MKVANQLKQKNVPLIDDLQKLDLNPSAGFFRNAQKDGLNLENHTSKDPILLAGSCRLPSGITHIQTDKRNRFS